MPASRPHRCLCFEEREKQGFRAAPIFLGALCGWQACSAVWAGAGAGGGWGVQRRSGPFGDALSPACGCRGLSPIPPDLVPKTAYDPVTPAFYVSLWDALNFLELVSVLRPWAQGLTPCQGLWTVAGSTDALSYLELLS